jgi:hypothetical protein
MQLEVKTVLNGIQHFVGFVYQDVRLCRSRGKLRIEARIEPHGGRRPVFGMSPSRAGL